MARPHRGHNTDDSLMGSPRRRSGGINMDTAEAFLQRSPGICPGPRGPLGSPQRPLTRRHHVRPLPPPPRLPEERAGPRRRRRGAGPLPRGRRGGGTPPDRAGAPLVITSHSNDTGAEAMRQAWQILSGGGSALDARGARGQRHRGRPGRPQRGPGRASEPGRRGPARRLHHGRADLQRRRGGGAGEHRPRLVGGPARHGAHRPRPARRGGRSGLRPLLRLRGGGAPHARGPGHTGCGGASSSPHRQVRTAGAPAGAPGNEPLRCAHAGSRGTRARHHQRPGRGRGRRRGGHPRPRAGCRGRSRGASATRPSSGPASTWTTRWAPPAPPASGEDVIKSVRVLLHRAAHEGGRSPQEACEDAIRMIVDRYRAVGLDYVPGEKFVAINRAGRGGVRADGHRAAPQAHPPHRRGSLGRPGHGPLRAQPVDAGEPVRSLDAIPCSPKIRPPRRVPAPAGDPPDPPFPLPHPRGLPCPAAHGGRGEGTVRRRVRSGGGDVPAVQRAAHPAGRLARRAFPRWRSARA
ncbi:MAG: hypothetical protein MZV63_06485 [Marinilabiliales bacterium]|nr:hypothetical protein [Marinilabiliales bacterium]